MTTKRILVLDDNSHILLIVRRALELAGFEVATAESGEEALALIAHEGLPHLAVVDIYMEGITGLEFCERVQQYSDLPVIMLTAVEDEDTVVQAIEQYAEDYMTKPFSPGELVARVQRVLNRLGGFHYPVAPLISIDAHLQIDFPGCRALVDGKELSLTPTEAKLLYILLRYAGQVVKTDYLLGRLWPRQVVYEDRLRVYVHRLRKKIETAATLPYIVSERGVGYAFQARPANPAGL